MAAALCDEHVRLRSDRLPSVIAAGEADLVYWQRHTVTQLEINTIIRGAPVPALLNGIHHRLEPGHAYLYLPGDVFSAPHYRGDGQLLLQWMRFDWPGWCRADARPDGIAIARATPLIGRRRHTVRAAMDQINALCQSGGPGWLLEAAGHVLTLLSLLRVDERMARDGAGGEHLALALAFIDRHLAEPLDAKSIAQAARISPDYLARLFKARLGQPPLRHVIERRLQEGRRLLLGDPARPVQDIARAVGIPHASHFARLFERRFGTTPRSFRLATAWHALPPRPGA